MYRLVAALALLIFGSAAVSAQTLRVRHDHDPWGGCEGMLEITAEGMVYQPDEGDHFRDWEWVDIQTVDRHTQERFTVLTYEDLTWHLGRDRAFDFSVLPGGGELDDALFMGLRENVARPLVDRIPIAIEPEYEVPVKHLHALGGCEGTLRFGPAWIVFESNDEDHTRTWYRDSDVAGLWSSGPFDLELRLLGKDGAGSGQATFRFQLRKPLNEEYYDDIRREFLLAR